MKKLMLNKGKAMACLTLICLFLAQGCRKENVSLIAPEDLPKRQFITESTIQHWIDDNPTAKLLTLDWSKAKQANIRGKQVVRIPTLNNDNITGSLNKGEPNVSNQSLKPKNNVTVPRKPGSNINYDTQHPPEVFFIQDSGNGKLHAYLLNFIPENKGDNNNDKRNGKLYEWNLNGDTIFVQQVKNNVLQESYCMKLAQEPPIESLALTLKHGKLQLQSGLKDKTSVDFWKWIANLPNNVIGWIGHLFGLSVYSENFNEGAGGWRLNINWGSIFGSGGDSNSTSGYLASGWPIYNAYMPGVYYQGMDIVADQAGQPNPGDPGNRDATSLDGSFEPYPNSHGPNVTVNTLTADYVITNLGIGTQEQQSFLRDPNNVEITAALADYIDKLQTITQDDIEFGQWAVEYLMANPGSFEDFKNQYLSPTIFDNLTSPVNAPDDPVIDNGIEVENLIGEAPSSGRLLATSPARGNTEDMTWGTNGNTAGIRSSVISKTNAELFAHMDRLFEICSINDGEMQTVSEDFIDVFRNNTGGTFSHSTLNRKVQESSSYKNYIKGFGKQLLTKLQAVNGDINSVAQFNLNNRPIFNGLKNKFNGLQILINDTEQTDIKIDNYNIDANGKFTVSLSVTIHDHFGLDKHDALTYQYKNLGFPAWWLLQHTRGYKPFETIINIRTRLHGHL